MIRLAASILLALPILAFDCTNDDDEVCLEQFTPVELDSFYYDHVQGIAVQICDLQNIDESKSQVDLVIKSQSDFEKYVECAHLVPIDFNTNTVFAGAFWTSGWSFVTRQEVLKKCDEYLYHIELTFGAAQVPTQVHYFVVVPKIENGAKVTFEVVAPE